MARNLHLNLRLRFTLSIEPSISISQFLPLFLFSPMWLAATNPSGLHEANALEKNIEMLNWISIKPEYRNLADLIFSSSFFLWTFDIEISRNFFQQKIKAATAKFFLLGTQLDFKTNFRLLYLFVLEPRMREARTPPSKFIVWS